MKSAIEIAKELVSDKAAPDLDGLPVWAILKIVSQALVDLHEEHEELKKTGVLSIKFE